MFPEAKSAFPVVAIYVSKAFLAVLIWFEIESLDIGIYFAPEVVPEVFAKYKGLPGQRMFALPSFILAI
jgi:hypothetical protein